MKLLSIAALLLVELSLTAVDLPVKSGLALWLDAREEPAARAAAGRPGIANGSPADQLADRSGSGRDAVQLSSVSRPTFRAAGDEAWLKFDGHDDFLWVPAHVPPAQAITVFVLASPRANPGSFSALFSAARTGSNDYTSGINLDFGPVATRELSVLNLETAGCPGFRDFLEPGKNLAAELPFAGFHVFTARSRPGAKGNEVFLDGIKLGERDRAESTIGLDALVVGGRFYSNDPAQPPYAQGFFQGDIAAVILFDRALTDAERESVEKFLFERTAGLNAAAGGNAGHALEPLSNPPIVQMLVPGFTVRELPIKLRNQTNVRYRHDGKLVALGYDGVVRLLTDTDGDGLEDSASIFWDKSPMRAPIGMELLPKNDPRGDGMFIASKEKIALILDRDRDGKGDEEITVASGWKETFHGVDALGIAVDPKDGSVYFSIGCENFANAYLVDPATGKSAFQLSTERGTIQRVLPDFSRRETVCTGVRFGCALAFNRQGDLFATDQEGATWLPNGNPLDELLQIVPGRHYGFPPRHPKHLPQVIDEPAVMEYGPQHQSTVGMVFNESVNGGPTFGPDRWRGDALICGESRGKIYRTRLVKTAEGYVGQNQIIACLGLLTVDNCVSPQGDLLIACHSGPPDWGTGPAGEGRLFKVRYENKDAPQPAWAWAAGPDEFRVAFDRPLSPEDWAGVKERVKIEAGRYVSAGDRYEVIRPGYQVVRDQLAAPRRWVELQSLSLSADRRTLVLRVPRQIEPVNYAVTLPLPVSWRTHNGIEQQPELDLAISLNGIRASSAEASIILPHPSPVVSRELTLGSEDHRRFFDSLAAKPRQSLQFVGQVNVGNIFVPDTQPGSTLDWDIGADAFAQRQMSVTETFSSETPQPVALKTALAKHLVRLEAAFGFKPDGTLAFALDDKIRPIALRRLFVPWAADPADQSATPGPPVARTDVHGRWLEGRRLFFGPAGCALCHTIRGEGVVFGPDLSNLVFRDRDSVLQDIIHPSATINPDHTGSLVKFIDDTDASGLVRVLNAQKIIVRLPAGIEIERPRAEVLTVEPMRNSLMPDGFGQALSAGQMEDLLTFLLTNPLEPASLTRFDPAPPPARPGKEFEPLWASTSRQPREALRLLLVADEKDHGIDEHDYPRWLERWSRLLTLADQVSVRTNYAFPTAEQLAAADVTVFYSRNSGWDAKAAALLDDYQQRRGGLVYLHWAIEGGKEPRALAERMGLAFSMSKFRHGPLAVEFTPTPHPITQGLPPLNLIDESYWSLTGDVSRITVLANSVEENQPRPQVWIMQHRNGRVFACIPGHYTWTFDDPLYRVLVLRGICWAGGQADINRLSELATVGARIAP